MLRRTLAALAAVTLTACSAAPETDIESSEESISTSFIADDLLSDQELTDEGALDEEAIQRFLERTPYGTRSRLADLETGGKRAARMIVEASRRHHISPLAVLVRAQMEQGLISARDPSRRAIDYAFGCGCPDNRPCDTAYQGFDRQTECMAGYLRDYLDDLTAGRATRGGWKTGVAKRTLDPAWITPRNHATAALYTYTPWRGSASNVMGNYLHWVLWGKFARHVGYQPGQPAALPLGAACQSDRQCSGGRAGTERVCGATAGVCIEACHSDDDCGGGERCDTGLSTWRCR
jgi:hypothetical protein